MRKHLVVLGALLVLLGTPAAWAKLDFTMMQVAPYDPPKPAPAFALPDL